MLDTTNIIRSLTDAGISHKHARAITAALQTTVEHLHRTTASHAALDAKEQLGLDLVVELVESRYRQKRAVFYQWVIGVLIAALAATAYILNAHLESAVAQINLAALQGRMQIDTVTQTSVAEIQDAKNALPSPIPDATVVASEARTTLDPGRLQRVEMDGQRASLQLAGIQQPGRYCIDAIAETEGVDPVIYLYSSPQFSEDSLVQYNDDRADVESLNARICTTLVPGSTYYLEVMELIDRPGTVLLYFERERAQ